jgi:hypothetical protein
MLGFSNLLDFFCVEMPWWSLLFEDLGLTPPISSKSKIKTWLPFVCVCVCVCIGLGWREGEQSKRDNAHYGIETMGVHYVMANNIFGMFAFKLVM